MTKEELEQLKELLAKADKTLSKKEDEYYKKQSLTPVETIYEIEQLYAVILDLSRLKIKLDIGTADEYLLNDENETESLR